MAAIVTVESHDDKSTYVLTAQATGPTTASISERRTDKATGDVTNSNYDLFGVQVINGVLSAQSHAPAFQTANVTLTLSPPGDNPSAAIAISHLWWGNQTIGPLQLAADDHAAIAEWTTNFPHS